MVSSNHSLLCSGGGSNTPQRRMCENSSSRACSKAVGMEILRGSERFLVMRGVLLSSVGPGTLGHGRRLGPRKPPIDRRRNVIGRFASRKGRHRRRGWYYHARGGGRAVDTSGKAGT